MGGSFVCRDVRYKTHRGLAHDDAILDQLAHILAGVRPLDLDGLVGVKPAHGTSGALIFSDRRSDG